MKSHFHRSTFRKSMQRLYILYLRLLVMFAHITDKRPRRYRSAGPSAL